MVKRYNSGGAYDMETGMYVPVGVLVLEAVHAALAAELAAAHRLTEDHRENSRSLSAQCIRDEARIAALEAALTDANHALVCAGLDPVYATSQETGAKP